MKLARWVALAIVVAGATSWLVTRPQDAEPEFLSVSSIEVIVPDSGTYCVGWEPALECSMTRGRILDMTLVGVEREGGPLGPGLEVLAGGVIDL